MDDGLHAAVVKTPSGYVTSIRLLEPTRDGSVVWTWRTDGASPWVWSTKDEAQAWVDDVWRCDPKEKAKAGWQVKTRVD